MKKIWDVFELFREQPRLSLITGGIFIFLAFLISDIPRMIVSQGWPSTEGTIVSRRLVGQKFKEYDGDFYTNVDGYLRYEYTVNDILYSSTSVNSIDSPFYPYDIAIRYTVGESVIVYYNPNNPSEAVLEPGFVNIFKAFNGFSFLSFVLGIYFVFLGTSRTQKMRDKNRRKNYI